MSEGFLGADCRIKRADGAAEVPELMAEFVVAVICACACVTAMTQTEANHAAAMTGGKDGPRSPPAMALMFVSWFAPQTKSARTAIWRTSETVPSSPNPRRFLPQSLVRRASQNVCVNTGPLPLREVGVRGRGPT